MTMEKKKNETFNVLHRMMEDKIAIRECIKKGGDLKKVAKERGLVFAKPL